MRFEGSPEDGLSVSGARCSCYSSHQQNLDINQRNMQGVFIPFMVAKRASGERS